MYSFHHGSLNI